MSDFLKRIFNKNLFKYLATGYLSTLLNIILNILLIKMLSPSSFGKITIGKSIFQSFEYTHLGLRYGLDRFLPHYTNEKEKYQIFSVALVFSFISSLFFVCFWFFYDLSNYLLYLAFSLSGVLYTLATFYRIYYRASENKNSFINLSFWILITPLLLQFLGLISFGLWGFITFYFIGYGLSYYICVRYYSVKIIIERKGMFSLLKKLFSHGYLLFLSGIINFLSTTGDRFLIAKYWGLELTASFSVIMFFFSALTLFSLNYTELIMNKIILKPTFNYIIKQITIVCIVAFFLFLLTRPIIPFIVTNLIPAYKDHIDSMSLILIGIIPYAALPILNNYFHATDKRNVLLGINLINTILYFIGLIIVLLKFNKMEALVLLKLISTLLITLATFVSFLYFEKKKMKEL